MGCLIFAKNRDVITSPPSTSPPSMKLLQTQPTQPSHGVRAIRRKKTFQISECQNGIGPKDGEQRNVRGSYAHLFAGLVAVLLSCGLTAQAAPTANDQSASPRSGSRTLLILSFSDATVTPSQFEILEGPEHGVLQAQGSAKSAYYYTSNSGYVGPDSFTWRCSDGTWSEPATCSLNVIPNSQANDQSVTVYNGVKTARHTIVLSSSYVVDQHRSGGVFKLVAPPEHGTLEWAAGQPVEVGVPVADASPAFAKAYAQSRIWYYTPDPGYVGPDSFEWVWQYGGLETSDIGTVNITVASNTKPVAQDRTRDIAFQGAGTINLASDVTGVGVSQTGSYTITSPPQYGRLMARSSLPNSLLYLPFDPGFMGTDSFQWKVSDGIDESNVATCTINPIPSSASPAPFGQREPVLANQPTVIKPLIKGSLSYSMELQIRKNPQHGTLTSNNSTLTFTYTPQEGFTGADAFDWRLRYRNGSSWVTLADITMPVYVCESLPMARDANHIGVVGQTLTKEFSYVSNSRWAPTYQPLVDIEIVDLPEHGVLRVTERSFVYTPDPGWAGEDQFTWKFREGEVESNIATNRILVREEADRAGMTVLVVVNDLLLPEIEPEINRLLADLGNEGYSPKLTPWSASSAWTLWEYLKSEYETPGQFVSGAILIGNLPLARSQPSDEITDYALMNMEFFGDTVGVDNKHIWVSRLIADQFAGGDALRIPWALDANHGYRTGIHRLPHAAYWRDQAYGMITSLNASNMLIVWPSVGNLHPSTVYRIGGDFQNSEIHANGAFGGWNWHPSQLRYSIHSSCGAGRLGGPVNRNVFSRGGGMVLSMGSTDTAYSMQNIVVTDAKTDNLRLLKRGDTFGHGITRGVTPYADYTRNMFYGDLSMTALMAPSNQLPIIQQFNSSLTRGVAPMDVNFYAMASDPDGSVALYEWFAEGYLDGVYGPTGASEVNLTSHTYTHPRRFSAEVQVVDDYRARRWANLDICVAPNPEQPLRIHCGRDATYYTPTYDYVAADQTLWQHDQQYAAGTWGCSGGSEALVSQDVVGTEDQTLYRRFREGASFSYRIPLPKGGYTINLHFADMRSTGSGTRIMDIKVQGFTRVEALDPAAEVGVKTAMVLPLNVVIEDEDEGMLLIEVARNASATANAFLNAIEIVPGLHAPQAAPYAADQTFVGQAGGEWEITLNARDPEGYPLTWTLISGPANGTLEGDFPNLVYTPTEGFSGADSFTVKVSDGTLESREIIITLDVLATPLIALTSPADSAVFTLPADVPIQASVGLLGQGGIAKVEFFQGEMRLHEAVSEPYEYLWAGVTRPGTYQLWARATTDNGITADSDPVHVTLEAQQVFEWKNGVTGSLLTTANWSPDGFLNTNVYACVLANGTATVDSSTQFQPTLTILGDRGVGGTLRLNNSSRTFGPNGIRLLGGRIQLTGTSSATLTSTLEVPEGTVSVVNPVNVTLTHSGALRGSGTILVNGGGSWKPTRTLDDFHGLIETAEGNITVSANQDYTFGSGARIRINAGGRLTLGSTSRTWVVPGGVFMNGGLYRDNNNGGTTWSTQTPWTIESESTIETAGTGGFVDIRGPMHGSETLNITRAAESGNRAVTLRGKGSTYSGLIRITNAPDNAFLYLGDSEAVASEGDLASLSIDLPVGEDVPGLVVIGARKSAATVTNIDNVHIKLRCLIVNGNWVEAGVYDQNNPGPTAGFVVFNNPLSSLEVMESDPGVEAGITSPSTASGTPGQPFTYTITADGTGPMNFSVSGLPPGLTQNGAVISGIPTEAGVYHVLVTASNLAGMDTMELTLVLNSAHQITASGGPGGVIEPSGLVMVADGADQEFIITPDERHVVQDVLVDGESIGAVTNYLFQSVSGTHEIQARFHKVCIRIAPVEGGGPGMSIRFATLPHLIYEVQYKDDLGCPSEWQVMTSFTGTGEEVEFVDFEEVTRRFYRLRVRN